MIYIYVFNVYFYYLRCIKLIKRDSKETVYNVTLDFKKIYH